MTTSTYSETRHLQPAEIEQLKMQGCTAHDWTAVQITEPTELDRIRHVHFSGQIRIGSLTDAPTSLADATRPVCLVNATIANCTIGHHVRIANVHGILANYQINDNAIIENIGEMRTEPDAQFGCGTELESLNEAGGREVILFPELSAQFAHLLCLHRYRGDLVKALQRIATQAAQARRGDVGTVGLGARINGVPRIINVDIGPAAIIDSAQSLENGAILSHPDAPTLIRNGVLAENFIIAEGSKVTDGVVLSNTFVGQGCQVGKQFSAENCLFFANCEAFHGEGCSVFAGPYTVTHHKSTLLIGGLFSFYNAGSATNQSNHRYKLGPTHEGKLERGCKTGSSSYIMWPCRVGPFSVVLGKHTRSFDTADLPFSHLEADANGRCDLIPGHYIATVGTLRDGAKWPKRDRRKGPVLRDQVRCDVFSPLTIGRMQRGLQLLNQLQETADRNVESVTTGGVSIKRVLLRTGRKRYAAYIERYLLEQIVNRLEASLAQDLKLPDVFAVDDGAIGCNAWVDIGGQLMPQKRFEQFADAIVHNKIHNIEAFQAACEQAHALYAADVWAWVKLQAEQTGLANLETIDAAALIKLVERFQEQQTKFLQLVLVDAEREFDDGSQIGFGMDTDENVRTDDFTAVRGRFEDNSFVQSLKTELEQLPSRCQKICQALTK